MAAHPETELVIENSSRLLDFESDSFDAGVRVGDGNWPDLVAQHLMDLCATPVATPAMVKRLEFRRPVDVARAPMIHVVAFPLAWPIWLRQAGAGAAKPGGPSGWIVSRRRFKWPSEAAAWRSGWSRYSPSARRGRR